MILVFIASFNLKFHVTVLPLAAQLNTTFPPLVGCASLFESLAPINASSAAVPVIIPSIMPFSASNIVAVSLIACPKHLSLHLSSVQLSSIHFPSITQICAHSCSGTNEVLALSDGFSDVDGLGVSEVDGFVVETLGTRLGDVESPLLVD